MVPRMDFFQSKAQAFSGGRVRVLCISDEYTRQSLAIVAGSSVRSQRVCGVLEELFRQQGMPQILRMDKDLSSLRWHCVACAIAKGSTRLTLSQVNRGRMVLLKPFTRVSEMSFWMAKSC